MSQPPHCIAPPQAWHSFLATALQRMAALAPLEVRGALTRLSGLALEATGLHVPVGAQCEIAAHSTTPHQPPLLAQVVGFAGGRAFLMPAGSTSGLASGAAVTPLAPLAPPLRLGGRDVVTAEMADGVLRLPEMRDGMLRLPVGCGLLGRVVDAQGQPLDGCGALHNVTPQPLERPPLNAMQRAPVREPLDTGVRAINALLTVGRGQRLGLFAGSGVGKSVLLGMITRYTSADVIVIGLIGERGREVKEFVQDILGEPGRSRAAIVAAPADAPPLLRMQGAAYATAIAEHFRDQGKHVLLLMDSLTRYAMAQREIALAIGEAPATKGYPPSCFARLPALVERSGNGSEGGGSITAFYTVLCEGDDLQDPIADAARAILDGHIVLSRTLAEGGHWPAIDLEQSASRVMHSVVSRPHLSLAQRLRALHAHHAKSRDLIQVGAYAAGSDAQLDEALRLHPAITAFLQQDMQEAASLQASVAGMEQVLTTGDGSA